MGDSGNKKDTYDSGYSYHNDSLDLLNSELDKLKSVVKTSKTYYDDDLSTLEECSSAWDQNSPIMEELVNILSTEFSDDGIDEKYMKRIKDINLYYS